jgi:hypothetical protein
VLPFDQGQRRGDISGVEEYRGDVLRRADGAVVVFAILAPVDRHRLFQLGERGLGLAAIAQQQGEVVVNRRGLRRVLYSGVIGCFEREFEFRTRAGKIAERLARKAAVAAHAGKFFERAIRSVLQQRQRFVEQSQGGLRIALPVRHPGQRAQSVTEVDRIGLRSGAFDLDRTLQRHARTWKIAERGIDFADNGQQARTLQRLIRHLRGQLCRAAFENLVGVELFTTVDAGI